MIKQRKINEAPDNQKCYRSTKVQERRMQRNEVVAHRLGSQSRFHIPPVYQTLWFHLAVDREQYQILAQHVRSLWHRLYTYFSRCLPPVWLPVWRCFCLREVWCAAANMCVWLGVGGLPYWLLTNWWCVHDLFFFFYILLNRRKAANMGTYIVCLICLTLLTGFCSTSGFDVNVEAKTGLRPGHRSGLAAVILRPTSRETKKNRLRTLKYWCGRSRSGLSKKRSQTELVGQ